MAEREHPWDGVADDLFDWMEGEVQYHTEALRAGYRSPFSAQTSPQDQQDYFKRRWFQPKPDGSVDYGKPNAQGRDELMKMFGTKQYADIAIEMKKLEAKAGRKAVDDFEEDEIMIQPAPEEMEELVP